MSAKFRLFDIFIRINLIFLFVQLSHLSSFIILFVLVLIYILVKEIGRFSKQNQPKQSTPTLKKPVLSSSAAHTPSTINSTGTPISSQLDNKDITANQNKNNTSNTDDIHSCVTPRKKNYSIQATYTSTCLTPLNYILPIAPVELPKKNNYPLPVKNICVFKFTEDLLMLPSVSNHG